MHAFLAGPFSRDLLLSGVEASRMQPEQEDDKARKSGDASVDALRALTGGTGPAQGTSSDEDGETTTAAHRGNSAEACLSCACTRPNDCKKFRVSSLLVVNLIQKP